MTLPRIIGSTERKAQNKAPPEKERIGHHKWLTNASLERYKESEQIGFDLYISKLAEEKLRNHALSRLSPPHGGDGAAARHPLPA